MTFKEQSDKLIERYNSNKGDAKTLREWQIKTLIESGKYFFDFIKNEVQDGNTRKECNCVYCKEVKEIKESINKLKEALK